jgi:hypothetical protein
MHVGNRVIAPLEPADGERSPMLCRVMRIKNNLKHGQETAISSLFRKFLGAPAMKDPRSNDI